MCVEAREPLAGVSLALQHVCSHDQTRVVGLGSVPLSQCAISPVHDFFNQQFTFFPEMKDIHSVLKGPIECFTL